MTNEITDVLNRLKNSTPEIMGGAVISIDGVLIAKVMPHRVDEDLFGGMASSMLGVGERISAELMNSEMQQLYVRSHNGYVIVNAVGENASLVVLVAAKVKLGLIFLELKRAINQLEQMIDKV